MRRKRKERNAQKRSVVVNEREGGNEKRTLD